MNNKEKQASKILKEKGFSIFWEDRGDKDGDFWAMHPKLISQYHVGTSSKKALDDLQRINENCPN